MTLRNAKAVLAAHFVIEKALDVCGRRLTGDDKVYFENYWGAHIRSIINGHGYGSAPIGRALETREKAHDR